MFFCLFVNSPLINVKASLKHSICPELRHSQSIWFQHPFPDSNDTASVPEAGNTVLPKQKATPYFFLWTYWLSTYIKLTCLQHFIIYNHLILLFRATRRSGCYPHFIDKETEAELNLEPNGSPEFISGASSSAPCLVRSLQIWDSKSFPRLSSKVSNKEWVTEKRKKKKSRGISFLFLALL